MPNIPLYYAGYKLYSASRALGGCSALRLLWSQTETDHLSQLREQLVHLQHGGVVFPKGSWPQQLIQQDARYAVHAPCVPFGSDASDEVQRGGIVSLECLLIGVALGGCIAGR